MVRRIGRDTWISRQNEGLKIDEPRLSDGIIGWVPPQRVAVNDCKAEIFIERRDPFCRVAKVGDQRVISRYLATNVVAIVAHVKPVAGLGDLRANTVNLRGDLGSRADVAWLKV